MDRDPYAEGADAYLAGRPETANPHDLDREADAAMSWSDGWNAADDAAFEDNAVLDD